MYMLHMQAMCVFALLCLCAFQLEEKWRCPSGLLSPGTRHHPSPAVPRRPAECWVWLLGKGEGHMSGTLPPQLVCSAHRLGPTGLVLYRGL